MKRKIRWMFLGIMLFFCCGFCVVNKDRACVSNKSLGKSKEYSLSIGEGEKICVLNFDSDGGEFIAGIAAEYGSAVTLPSCSKDGYWFDCWVTEEGTEYQAGEHIVLRKDITLTAKWNNVLYGDVNGDNKVNAADRTILSRYIAKWNDYTDESIQMEAADVNCDGKVNAADRTILSRYIAKWEGYTKLPYEN